MTSQRFQQQLLNAGHDIAAVSRRLYQHGWSPATSSNYSVRLDADHCAITVSGRDKGLLNDTDVMVVDMQNRAVTAGKPSAETALHTQLYRQFPDIGAVLHTHSIACTVLTMHWPDQDSLVLAGYELLKALEGVTTHDISMTLPVFANTQDIDALAAEVEPRLAALPGCRSYLIRGHGMYTWASDLTTCYRQVEALEFLFMTELERRKLGGQP